MLSVPAPSVLSFRFLFVPEILVRRSPAHPVIVRYAPYGFVPEQNSHILRPSIPRNRPTTSRAALWLGCIVFPAFTILAIGGKRNVWKKKSADFSKNREFSRPFDRRRLNDRWSAGPVRFIVRFTGKSTRRNRLRYIKQFTIESNQRSKRRFKKKKTGPQTPKLLRQGPVYPLS